VHRREGALGVELPLVDLGEVKEQLGLGCTGFANELPRTGEKVVIVHDSDCQICSDHAVNGSTLIWGLRSSRCTHERRRGKLRGGLVPKRRPVGV
jgi:hypothetical protein